MMRGRWAQPRSCLKMGPMIRLILTLTLILHPQGTKTGSAIELPARTYLAEGGGTLNLGNLPGAVT